MVVLGKGESKDVVITCPFEPEQVVVDPDAKVLQLRRKNAVAEALERVDGRLRQIGGAGHGDRRRGQRRRIRISGGSGLPWN